MIDIIARGIELMPAAMPKEWDQSIALRLDSEPITITFQNAKVLLAPGDLPEPESVIELTSERLCNIIDGGIDFMTVWRELAEPSPTDRTYIKKGSGAKFFALLDGLIKCYRSNADFKKLVDDYKARLKP